MLRMFPVFGNPVLAITTTLLISVTVATHTHPLTHSAHVDPAENRLRPLRLN